MAVNNGQRANQETFNDAFLSRTQDSDTTGIVGLNNNSSGPLITNAQQKINDVDDLSKENETDISILKSTKENKSEKDQPDGYAGLDAQGKILASQLPVEVVTLEGNWDADTNTPTLVDGTGDVGQVYVVSVAGDQDLGSGVQTFKMGDWVLFNSDLVWEKVINTNAVKTVNGQVGDVTLNLNDINDVDTSAPQNGEVLTYDAGQWVNTLPSTGVQALSDLDDVDTTGVQDGDLLVYDNLAGEFLPGQVDSLPDQTGNDGKFLTTDGNQALWDDLPPSEGGGSKNYFTLNNSKFLDGTIGDWLTDDGAGSASAGLTLSATNVVGELIGKDFSLKLEKDAADRDGHFIKLLSQTIEPIDRGKVNFGSFAFKPISGYVSGDLIVEVYDVTNSAVLYSGQAEDLELLNVSDAKTFNYVAYLESTTDEIELRLKVNNTNTNGFTIVFDEFRLGPASVLPATFERYEEIELINSGAQNLNGVIKIGRTGNAVNISSDLLTHDSASTVTSAAGVVPSWAIPTETNTNVFVAFPGGTFRVQIFTDGSIDLRYLNTSFIATARTTSGSPISGSYPVPSTPFTMTTNELGLQTIAVSGAGNGATAVTANVTDITFTEVEDKFNAWNGSQFTAPRKGRYSAKGFIRSGAIVANIYSHVNGAQEKIVGHLAASSTQSRGFSWEGDLEKGDTLSFRLDQDATLVNSSVLHWITIKSDEDLTLYGAVRNDEYLEAVTGAVTTNLPTVGEFDDVVSVTLSPGTWDLHFIALARGSVGDNQIQGGIGSIPGDNGPNLSSITSNLVHSNNTNNGRYFQLIDTAYNLTFTETTEVYGKWRRANSNTTHWGGKLSARRIK